MMLHSRKSGNPRIKEEEMLGGELLTLGRWGLIFTSRCESGKPQDKGGGKQFGGH